MGAKAGVLYGPRALVVEVVESRLADRHHLGMGRHADQFLDGHVGLLARIVWVGADRAVDIVVGLGDRQHLVELAHPGRDRDHHADAGGLGARDDGVEFLGEIRKIEMAVAVDDGKAHPRGAPASCST